MFARAGRGGRLCSAEYTQGGVTYSDCTTAPNPDAVAGKEWCAVEPGLAGSDWSYCAPKARREGMGLRRGQVSWTGHIL